MLPELTSKAGMELRITLHQIHISEIYYEKMPLIWYIIKTFTFDVKHTYVLSSVAVLQSKSETDSFYGKRLL